MSHPKSEELAEFLYDELPPGRQAELMGHIEVCAQCRQRVESWRKTRSDLAAWELPSVSVSVATTGGLRRRGFRTLRWAAAGAVLLASGYGLANLSDKPADLASLRTELAREVRQEVRQELTTELARHAAAQSVQQRRFQEAVVEAMAQLETRQVVDHASLRKDVETVALRTQEEFLRLTSYDAGGPPR